MTVNGWLQIGFFLLAILAVTPRARALHDAGLQSRADVARPGASPRRAADLSIDRRRRDARDALDRVRRLGAAVQRRLDAGALSDAARAAVAALESAGIRRRSARPRVQYRRVVHDQHELAGLQRRVDDELFHADGRPRVPQLHVGGGRHRGRDRVHPRRRPEGERHARQLLGRSGARPALGPAADLHRRRAVARVAGRRPEPPSVRQGGRHRSADGDDDRMPPASRRRRS